MIMRLIRDRNITHVPVTAQECLDDASTCVRTTQSGKESRVQRERERKGRSRLAISVSSPRSSVSYLSSMPLRLLASLVSILLVIVPLDCVPREKTVRSWRTFERDIIGHTVKRLHLALLDNKLLSRKSNLFFNLEWSSLYGSSRRPPRGPTRILIIRRLRFLVWSNVEVSCRTRCTAHETRDTSEMPRAP
jgi:hypothetical protein